MDKSFSYFKVVLRLFAWKLDLVRSLVAVSGEQNIVYGRIVASSAE